MTGLLLVVAAQTKFLVSPRVQREVVVVTIMVAEEETLAFFFLGVPVAVADGMGEAERHTMKLAAEVVILLLPVPSFQPKMVFRVVMA